MNSGSAPQTTRSSTSMPTRSKPMVWCTSIACAMATLVPTPSALVASSGRSYCLRALASNRPAKPPIPPSTSGRRAFSTHTFISSTALSPASRDTPASAYVAPGLVLLTCPRLAGRSGAVERVRRATGDADADTLRVAVTRGVGRLDREGPLEEVLAEELLLGQRDRVVPVEARQAQLLPRLPGRGHHLLRRDVAQRVGADAGPDLLDAEAGGDELGTGGEVDAVEARPAHRRGGDAHVDLRRARLAQH